MPEKELPMGLRFSLLHRAFRKKMDERLSEKELTGVQFGVLSALLRMEQVKTGETSSRDRRFKSISSTDKALRLRDDMARVEEDTFQWLCRGLEPEQVQSLLAITDRMLENAWADCPKGCEKAL